MKYKVTDGNGDIEVEADSSEEACQEYVDGGDWGSTAKTSWVTCTATPINGYDYSGISADGQTWIDDLRRNATETLFPDLDPSAMTAEERDTLAEYLRANDGSLSDGDQEASEDYADEIGDLTVDGATHTIELPPTEPECCGGVHDWASPHSVVGGCAENPGVYGSGGGVIMTEVCRHCGRYQVINTWAQNPENGEQGLTSVEYGDANENSEAWLTRRYDAAEKFVEKHSDEDELEAGDVEKHFANYFHRLADDDDRKAGLWSLLCQAVGVEAVEK